MSWFKKVFDKNKNQETIYESKELELLAKLDASIKQCTAGIKKSENEIDQIRKWSAEAIQETFEVPSKFWYEELNHYIVIKSLPENELIHQKVILKCDEIIEEYLEQIKLREAKIKLYNSLVDKYEQSKNKMLAIRKRHEEDLASRIKLEALEKHSLRLEQMKTNPENIDTPIEESLQLDLLKNEVKEVYEEFEINEEVRTHLEEINSEFKTSNLSSDSKLDIDKIEKLTNQINTGNQE